MDEQGLIDIIADALLNSEKINYIVRIFNNRGLQIETADKRHYNLVIRDIDKLKGHIIPIRHEKRER